MNFVEQKSLKACEHLRLCLNQFLCPDLELTNYHYHKYNSSSPTSQSQTKHRSMVDKIITRFSKEGGQRNPWVKRIIFY